MKRGFGVCSALLFVLVSFAGIPSHAAEIPAPAGEVSTLAGEVSTLAGEVSTLAGEVSTLAGEVSTLYSLDYTSRTYQLVTDEQDIREARSALAADASAGTLSPAEIICGFLTVTDEGKTPVYLPQSAARPETARLIDLSRRFNEKYPRHIQWLCYMSTDKIQSIAYDGVAGGVYSPNAAMSGAVYAVSLDTDRRDNIEKLAACLKELQVKPAKEIYSKEGENALRGYGANPGNDTVRIAFEGGVTYVLTGNAGSFTVSSSDMPECIVYEFTDGAQLGALRDLAASLPEARLVKWD